MNTIQMIRNLQKEYDNQDNPGYEDEYDGGDYDPDVKELNFDDDDRRY